MSSTLLVLGGGALSVPVLRWAREAGLGVYLADPDPRAPGRRLAHEFQALPSDDAAAHAAFLRHGASDSLAGVLATERRALPLLARLAELAPEALPARRALELVATPEVLRSALAQRGFTVADETEGLESVLDVFAFFRDGAFAPGGIAARTVGARGTQRSLQPSGLSAEDEFAAHRLAERAGRALGFERGPLQVTLARRPGELVLVAVQPAFLDLLGAGHVAQLARGKSPLQAWFAHLAGAGGPFDEVARETRGAAGWLALFAERAGLFAGLDGLARARALPGVAGVLSAEPGRVLASPELEREPLAHVWATAHDREELAERLDAARAVLEVRFASREQREQVA